MGHNCHLFIELLELEAKGFIVVIT